MTTALVCAKCGGERIDVEFSARGRGAAEIGVDADGKPYVDHVTERGYDDWNEDYEMFECADCNATWYPLAKGLRPAYAAGIDFHQGDVVVLPDGFRAVVDEVDGETNTFTVEGWHERFSAGEGAPLGPPVGMVA